MWRGACRKIAPPENLLVLRAEVAGAARDGDEHARVGVLQPLGVQQALPAIVRRLLLGDHPARVVIAQPVLLRDVEALLVGLHDVHVAVVADQRARQPPLERRTRRHHFEASVESGACWHARGGGVKGK